MITPNDKGYEKGRRVFNAIVDRRPTVIVVCSDTHDVSAAVDFARDNQLDLAVRGGGHSVPGFGTVDDGVVIDLSGMTGVLIDPELKTAGAQGGVTWGSFNDATHASTTGGIVSTTGVGGLTLGGGIGYLARGVGLSCDNLISAEVVTADGRSLVASDRENEDLFLGVRGGGGNFGVVTSFEFRLHPIKDIYGGPMFFDLDDAGTVLRPTGSSSSMPPRSSEAPGVADRATAPVHSGGAARRHHAGLRGLLGGTARRGRATFAYRDATFVTVIAGMWPDPADNEANIKWVRDYYEATAPLSEEGGYINFMADDDQDRIKANYKGNYERLVEVKRKYPDNLFHLNQNIRP